MGSLKPRFFLTAAICGMILSGLPARAATNTPITEFDRAVTDHSLPLKQQTHMLSLRCNVSEKTIRQSRIAVLDLPKGTIKSGYDAALVTGHGLLTDRACYVRDFAGSVALVEDFRLAPDYKPGEKTDWAIVIFKSLKTKNLVRYPLQPIADDLPGLDLQAVQFAQALGLPMNSQSCQLELMEFQKLNPTHGKDFLTHSCKAIAGQSGSPITMRAGAQNYLVGLHLGHIYMMQSPKTGRPERRGYILPVDTSLIEDIETAIGSFD